MTEPKRKGAKSIKDIPEEILALLNRGEIETANLVEWLAINQRALIRHLLKQCNREIYLKPILQGLDLVKKPSILKVDIPIGLTPLFLTFDPPLFWIHVLVNIHVCQ